MKTYSSYGFPQAMERVEGAERDRLVRRRVELNAQIRIAKVAAGSIPLLAPKPWARSWQSSHQAQYKREIRRCERELAKIAEKIGPAPKFFKPLAISAAFAKCLARHTRGCEEIYCNVHA